MDKANFKGKQGRKLVPPHVVGGNRCYVMLAGVLKSAYVKQENLAPRSVFRNIFENDRRISDLCSAIWHAGAKWCAVAATISIDHSGQ